MDSAAVTSPFSASAFSRISLNVAGFRMTKVERNESTTSAIIDRMNGLYALVPSGALREADWSCADCRGSWKVSVHCVPSHQRLRGEPAGSGYQPAGAGGTLGIVMRKA